MKNLIAAAAIAAFSFGAWTAPALANKCGIDAQQRGGCIPLPPPSCPLFKKNCGETNGAHV